MFPRLSPKPSPASTRDDRPHWLRLFRTPGIGPIQTWRLIKAHGSAAEALDNLSTLARIGGRRDPYDIPPMSRIEDEIAHAIRQGIHLIAGCETRYPPLLATIPGAPPILSVLGRPELLTEPQIALVGARNASLAGRKLAGLFADGLASRGFVITSGLAMGIDAAAHLGTLPRPTIAVLAGGVDIAYPRECAALHARIPDEGGALVSEMPAGLIPKARHFPPRNRIIAGLSQAVVVVEAALQSGSLITARHALEFGREVMAVPGSPLEPRCQGSNLLLREGARLVQSPYDILEDLSGVLAMPLRLPLSEPALAPAAIAATASPAPKPVIAERDLSSVCSRLLGLLGPQPSKLEDLTLELAVEPGILQRALIALELAGSIERRGASEVARIA